MRLVLLAATASSHTQKWYKQLKDAGIEVILITAAPLGDGSIEEIVIGDSRSNRLAYPLNSGKVKRIIAEIKPDIVHAYYASGYGWWGARSRFHPLVISVWGSDITVTPRESWLAAKMIRYNLSHADIVCATSRYLADATIKFYPEIAGKMSVVPFGIDISKFKASTERSFDNMDVAIGSARSLERIYGLDVLLKAFKIVLEEIPGAKLRLAGDGPKYRNLSELARRLGIAKNVEFLGHIAQDDMPPFLRSIDMFIIPSREEAFGVAALEAMACGIPVIGSAVGGIIEVLRGGQCGVLVKPDNPDELSAAIIKLACDPEKRKLLSETGRKLVVDNYEVGRCVKMQLAVYNQLLSIES